MRIDFKKATSLVAVFLFSITCLSAYSGTVRKDSLSINRGIRVGFDVSTLGVGGTITKNISKRFDIRLNGSYLGYLYDISKLSTELNGDARMKVGAVGTCVDFYVFRFLYLSGGVSYNFTSVNLQAQMKESISVGDILLEPQDIGSLQVTISPGSKFDPYFGGGITFRRQKKFNFGLELGLFLQGPPDVKLQANGMLEPTASPEQEQIMEKNISPLIYYPYVSFRFSYRIKK